MTVVLMLEQEVTGAKEDLGVAPNLNFPHLHKTQIYIKLNPNKLTSTSSVAAAVKYCSTAATAMGLQTKKWLQFQEWRVHTYGPGHAILDGDRQGDLPTDSSTFLKMASSTGWLIRPTFLLLKYEQRDF